MHAVDSPKKWTNEFGLFALKSKSKKKMFVHFLGESTVRQSAYCFIWPLKGLRKHFLDFLILKYWIRNNNIRDLQRIKSLFCWKIKKGPNRKKFQKVYSLYCHMISCRYEFKRPKLKYSCWKDFLCLKMKTSKLKVS